MARAPAEPAAANLRLFVAIEVPDDVRAALDERLRPFRAAHPVARWTAIESWHVTLKFLGSTPQDALAAVLAAADAAARTVPPFRTRLTLVGAFPSARAARVLWAGLSDDEGRLGTLATELDRRLTTLVEPERRAFTPHLTLARLRVPANVEREAPELVDLSLGGAPFDVVRLVVFRSRLHPRGARYEALHYSALAAGAGA